VTARNSPATSVPATATTASAAEGRKADRSEASPAGETARATPAAPAAGNNAPAANDSAPVSRTPTPTAQIAREILARAEVVTQNGRTEFHLRLDPPELGSVQVHVTATANSLVARFVVGQESTHQLLQSQLPAMRQALAEAGLSFTGFDVTRQGSGAAGQQGQPDGRPPDAPLAAPFAGFPTGRSDANRSSIPTLTTSAVASPGGIDVLV
jgi:flagellar hook-length control protein FliK